MSNFVFFKSPSAMGLLVRGASVMVSTWLCIVCPNMVSILEKLCKGSQLSNHTARIQDAQQHAVSNVAPLSMLKNFV